VRHRTGAECIALGFGWRSISRDDAADAGASADAGVSSVGGPP
jgi:hypothetical protein